MKRMIMKYHDWTKEELIKRVIELEGLNNVGSMASKRHKQNASEIKMSEYSQGKVALKVYYNGRNYHGFASQSTTPHSSISALKMDSVEDYLFRAIYSTRLALPGQDLQWSRAGRTDAGVSATGQVIAAKLRTLSKKNSVDDLVDFSKILNPQLPDDIRVIGWCPVPDSFNARFDCRYRQYKYYFLKAGLNISAMRQAAGYLIGEHDFRNFCRKDPSKKDKIINYHRRILECDIEDIDADICALVIKGSAFLYNQVRCTMAVLFMVGQAAESPDIVTELLNTQLFPKRPLYKIAAEHHLVLHECGYDPSLSFHLYSSPNVWCEQAARAASMLAISKLALSDLSLKLAHPSHEGSNNNREHARLKDRPTEK